MRRLVRWTVVTLGVAALVRWLRRRGEQPQAVEGAAPADPAQELRRKLAETRGDTGPAAATDPPSETVDERRAEVHEQARAALSAMAPTDEE